MKKAFLKPIVLLFILTLLSCSNKNTEDQLPPITQTGANTFGAIVDGRTFIPSDSYSTTPGTPKFKGLQVYVGNNFKTSKGDDKWTILTGNFKLNPSIYIYIYIPSLKDLSTSYIINSSDGLEDSDLSNAHIYCHINGNSNTYLSTENSGILEFSRLDIINGIYSGIFSVKLKNKNDENDIIKITEGRFDINLNTVNK